LNTLVNSLPNPTKSRILGIDVIRLLSFLAIVCYHVSYALWAPDGRLDVAVKDWWVYPFEVYARALVFSGFTIVFISFFLYGYKPSFSKKWKYLWILLLVFLSVWTYTTEETTDSWDIYQYLLATVLMIALVRLLRIPAKVLAFTAFIVVSIPFWKLEGLWPQIPPPLESALWGLCYRAAGEGADWPLLPWLAYPLLAYAVGILVREHRPDFARIEIKELVVWIALILTSIPLLGTYYVSPLGTGFGCYVFRQAPLQFWAHQIWIWFLIRLSLTDKIQEKLQSSPAIRWVSRRQINRRFFLVYFLHFPLIFLAAQGARQGGVAYVGFVYFSIIVTTMLSLEVLPIVISKISAKIKF